MTITTRQDKVRATIANKTARLEKIKSGELDKKFRKEAKSIYANMVASYNDQPSFFGYLKKYIDQFNEDAKMEDLRSMDIARLESDLVDLDGKLERAIELDEKEELRLAKKEAKQAEENAAIIALPECLKAWIPEAVKYHFDADVKWAEAFLAKELPEYLQYKSRRGNRELMLEYARWQHNREEAIDIRLNPEKHRKSLERDFNLLAIDICYRVKAKCGAIVDTCDLHIRQGVLNGFVKGETDTVEVRSILAGGYNIQRLHVRVLVL